MKPTDQIKNALQLLSAADQHRVLEYIKELSASRRGAHGNMAENGNGAHGEANGRSRASLKIGHVHLKVRTLARSIPFYTEVLGLKLEERVNRYAFLSYGDEHHDVAINEVGDDAPLPDPQEVGLFHFAIETSSLDEFKRCYQRLQEAGIPVSPVDHGISKALYFKDPDQNGIEIYLDTRYETGRMEWRGEFRDLDMRVL